MNLEYVLQMVDEYGLAMRDDAKQPGSISPAALNQQREKLRDSIRRLAVNDQSENKAAEAASIAIAAASVDRTRTTLTDGRPVTPGHREIDPATGQQKGYVVLSADERAKGFVRPVRQSYVHDKCGGVTTMGLVLAETYASDPAFYSGTFCAVCRSHFPVGADGEFTWEGTTERVGT